MSNVPKLRFKEFTDNWDEKLLGDLADIKTGNKDTQNKVEDGLYPFFVRSQTIERINSYSFDGEAILTAGDGVGVGKVFHYLNEKFDYHQRVYNIHNFKEYVVGKYVFFYFSEKFYKRVIRLSAKNSVDSVRMEMISKMEIPLPTKQEQEKIALFLTSVDTKIEQLTKKEKLLQQYKKGVMQKIFSQEIRFKKDDSSEFCDWKETKLNNFLIERVDYPKNVLPIYSLTIENGIIPKSERYERAFLVKDDYEYKTMKKDDFAFNPMNLRFGALARHKEDLDVMVSKYYNIFYCNEKLNAYFAELYFTNYDSIQYYNKMATGSLEEKKRVHFKEFLKFRFKFPCLEEQNKIANFLYSIDTKIQQTQKQLELSKEFKKALLQQMFV